MKRIPFILVVLLGSMLSPRTSLAQIPSTEVNPHSLHPVPEAEKLFRKRVWREIDFVVPINKPFFSHQKEITKFIIEGVQAGQLTPYKDEAFQEAMLLGEFMDNLKLPVGEEHAFTADDDGWGEVEEEESDAEKPQAEAVDYFLPHEVSIAEIMEDWIFDKIRSEQYYDIQSFKLIIPAKRFETGLRKVVGIFRYKDLAQYLDAKKVVWVNTENSAGHIKMTDAFQNRLFLSRITKVDNVDNLTLADIYKTPEAEAAAAQRFEEQFSEKECSFWAP